MEQVPKFHFLNLKAKKRTLSSTLYYYLGYRLVGYNGEQLFTKDVAYLNQKIAKKNVDNIIVLDIIAEPAEDFEFSLQNFKNPGL